MARSFWGDAFTATVDEVMPFHSDPYPAAALEYKLRKMFSLRVGYKGDKSLDQELTYGAGFETSVFKVDYAFVPFEDLGDSHRISVTLRFGKNVKRRTTDEQLALRTREAETLFAQGLLVDAYLVSIQVQRVAPWLDANNRLISKIQKDFQDLEESDRKEKQRLQAEALFKRAEQFFVEGNLINARLEFQTLLGLDPGHKQAQSYLKQIEGQFRSFLDSFYREGMLAFAEENYEKAKEEFEKVLAIRPDHAEAREQLSRCVEVIAEKEKEARELAAHYLRIPVAHVEAGLRTGNHNHPFPEESNRKLTDAIATLLFAPTEAARGNLLADLREVNFVCPEHGIADGSAPTCCTCGTCHARSGRDQCIANPSFREARPMIRTSRSIGREGSFSCT